MGLWFSEFAAYGSVLWQKKKATLQTFEDQGKMAGGRSKQNELFLLLTKRTWNNEGSEVQSAEINSQTDS